MRSSANSILASAFFLLCAAAVNIQYAQGATASEYNAVGVERYSSGDWAAAIENFEKAYELAPGEKVLRRNLCNAYQALAKSLAESDGVTSLSKAVEYLVNAVSVDPENVSPLAQLGAYYLRLDYLKDAIFRLEEAIEIDPNHLDAHELLGDAYYKDGDTKNALVQWEWVYKAAPSRKHLSQKIQDARQAHSVEGDFKTKKTRDFTISFERGTEGQDVSKVRGYLDEARRELGRAFQRVYPPAPIHVTVFNLAVSFKDATLLGEHVGAVYDGTRIRVPLLDNEGALISDSELRRRLFHEYVHVILRHLARENVPFWINEGLAEELSTEVSPMVWRLLKENVDSLRPLRELEGQQLNKLSPEELSLAYRHAHVAIDYLVKKRGGMRYMLQFINDLAEGVPADRALANQYRRTYETLDSEVREYIMQH